MFNIGDEVIWYYADGIWHTGTVINSNTTKTVVLRTKENLLNRTEFHDTGSLELLTPYDCRDKD